MRKIIWITAAAVAAEAAQVGAAAEKWSGIWISINRDFTISRL